MILQECFSGAVSLKCSHVFLNGVFTHSYAKKNNTLASRNAGDEKNLYLGGHKKNVLINLI